MTGDCEMGIDTILNTGKFIITAEISPPKGTDTSGALAEAALLQDIVDAVNVTDNQRAVLRMSSIALCHQLAEMGVENIMHLTCRDRNRLMIQSDLLAAHALGIRNILAMSGDFTTMGDQPSCKPVFDLDSVHMLQLITNMNKGLDFNNNTLDGSTCFCAGTVANPAVRPMYLALIKLNKKVTAGTSFIQTQAVFDADLFNEFMEGIRYLNIPVIAGIIPLRSFMSATFMVENIPGINIPQETLKRMKSSANPVSEGLKIAVEIIDQIRDNCHGVHIMPIGSHENTRHLLEMSALI
jgi:methylenetetrahydrofolate reductase (NADPH)